MKDHQDNDAPEYDGPSKSQLKREMHALQDLGKRMLDLSNDQLETLPVYIDYACLLDWEACQFNYWLPPR